MWITVFLVCFCQYVSSTAQEVTNVDQQAVIDSSQVNQNVKWDNTRPAVTLSIRNGRSERINRTQNNIYDNDQSLFYSNQWQPILMPIGFNQNDDINRYQTDSEFSLDRQFAPTFLRRPDSDLNTTVSSAYSNPLPLNMGRGTLSQEPVPTAPIMFYPPPYNFYQNDYNDVKILQNSSSTIPESVVSDSIRTNPEDNPEVPQTESIPVTPGISGRYYPENLFRNAGFFLPPRTSAYAPPYPVPPYSFTDSFQPIINPNFNRQSSSEPREIFPPVEDISHGERQSNSDPIREDESNPEEIIPRETSTNIVPPPSQSPPLPFPVGGFPFGAVPPSPFVPPLIPNILPPTGRSFIPNVPLSRHPFIANFPPRGVPLNPFYAPFTNVPRQAGIVDEVLPAPAVEASPPLESPSILPPVEDLQPEQEISTSIKVDTESVLENERPNSPQVPYEFGYDMNDGQGTDQHRKEVSDGSGLVTGSYGYRDLFGVYRLVNYIADKDGFRAFIKSNEPGVASAGSANVVVMAERPPPNAIAEGIKASEPQAVVVEDETVDLTVAGSETQAE